MESSPRFRKCHPEPREGSAFCFVGSHAPPPASPLACHPEPIRRGWVKDLNFHMIDQQMSRSRGPAPPPHTCHPDLPWREGSWLKLGTGAVAGKISPLWVFPPPALPPSFRPSTPP